MSEEQNTQAAQQEAGAAEGKKKKINKLGVQAVSAKIKELEEKNQATSRYYKHLVQRKNEMEASS